VGDAIFIGGITIFSRGYLGAGQSRYAGFGIIVGWIVQFIGVGILCLGILALT
jgi:hypothetical protein